jgi:hypothetical protein
MPKFLIELSETRECDDVQDAAGLFALHLLGASILTIKVTDLDADHAVAVTLDMDIISEAVIKVQEEKVLESLGDWRPQGKAN